LYKQFCQNIRGVLWWRSKCVASESSGPSLSLERSMLLCAWARHLSLLSLCPSPLRCTNGWHQIKYYGVALQWSSYPIWREEVELYLAASCFGNWLKAYTCMVESWLILMTDPRLRFSQHLGWLYINTSSVSLPSANFCRHAIECQSIHMTQSTLSQLSTDCPSSVACVLTKMLTDYWLSVGYRSRCRSRVHRGVDQVLIEGWSRVSIDMTTDVLSTHDTSIGL